MLCQYCLAVVLVLCWCCVGDVLTFCLVFCLMFCLVFCLVFSLVLCVVLCWCCAGGVLVVHQHCVGIVLVMVCVVLVMCQLC